MEENNAVDLQRSEWILILLRKRSLDRIHIMKTLFLIWNRSDRDIRNYFHFEPYLYGPYSLDVYSELRNLQEQGLVVHPPHPIQQWSKYYLTIQGNRKAEKIIKRTHPKNLSLINEIIEEVADLGFLELLEVVYREAPDFKINSIFKDVIGS